jgi:glutamyl-tRNA reductase
VRLSVIGLNHRTAPVGLREALALPSEAIGPFLRSVIALPGVVEAMLLSTCNRVELYLIKAEDDEAIVDGAAGFFADHCGQDPQVFVNHGYILPPGEAAKHLFRVTASLDSMVVGEPQILGQVKEAVALARGAGTVGPLLDRILDVALKTAKRIRSQTEIGKARVSMGSVAVELARRIFSKLSDCRVLLIGAGKMGESTARCLADGGADSVYIANRSKGRAQALAEKWGWRARSFSEVEELLSTVDVVITSTGSPQAIIDVPLMKRVVKARKYRPLFLVDIAVPRDVEPTVGEMDTIYLYNVDDLGAISDKNMKNREREAAVADQMVDGALEELRRWYQSLELQPTIAAIRNRALTVGQDELARTLQKRLGHLSDADRHALEKMMEATVSKLLHPAMMALKESSNGAGHGLVGAARILYGLDDDEEGEHPEEGDAAEETSP